MADHTENVQNENNEMKTENMDQNQGEASQKVAEDTENETEKVPEKKEEKPTAKKKVKLKTNKTDPDDSQTATLKLVQNHYAVHSKSTLPHILTEYGMEDKTQTVSKKEKSKQKKKSKKSDLGEDTDDEDKAYKKAREQRLRRELIDNDGNSYYEEYIEFLEQRVQEQRRRLKEKEEEEKQARLKALEEKQKHRYERKLQRVELTHDDSFLRDLPKTDIARIVILQDRMRKEGKLKTQRDVDRFWTDIRKPDVFYEQFKVYKSDNSHFEPFVHENYNRSSQDEPEPAPVTSEPAGPNMPPRSLSHISEASSHREPWAITQKYQSSHGPKSAGEKSRKSSTQLAKDAAMDLERRCPKLEMPPLSCFNLQLGEKPPDPEEILKKMELKAREKARKKSQRKLQKMYQMAMTNTAAANRILEKHTDLTDILEGAALRDVISVFDEPYLDLDDYYREVADPSRIMGTGIDRLSEASGSQSRQSSAGSRKLTPISDTASKASAKRKKKKTPEVVEEPPKILPLSYDDVFTREKTVEAKCLSTFWTNYTGAGKSVFAQS